MVKYWLGIFLFISAFVFAENTDSLYNRFMLLTHNTQFVTEKPSPATEITKCETPLMLFVKQNINKFTVEQQDNILKSGRPNLDTSIVSPSGFFRIHFDKTGDNMPSYSIDELAAAFDSVYNFEVLYLGYNPPPSDLGLGGDDCYDIYIMNLGSTYGYTEPGNVMGASKYTSHIVLDNKYNIHHTKGIQGARVTAAHEFHHAIQMGGYIMRSEDTFFYEFTSTSMEEFMYPGINDYYNYLDDFFNQPGYRINYDYYAYALGIFNIFLKERFGYNVIKRAWELMPNNRALKAIALAISEYGSSFGYELNQFGIWTFYTGYRADTEKYFKDGDKYPLLKYLTSVTYTPPLKSIMLNVQPASNNYIRFIVNTDTLCSVITNMSLNDAIDYNNTNYQAEYSLQSTGEEPNKIGDNLYYSLSSSFSNYFKVANVSADSAIYNKQNGSNKFVYPNPYNYSMQANGTLLHFPVIFKELTDGNLYIYDTSLKLVYSTKCKINTGTNPSITWNGLTSNGKLNSGVYIYVTESDGEICKGKFVVFND